MGTVENDTRKDDITCILHKCIACLQILLTYREKIQHDLLCCIWISCMKLVSFWSEYGVTDKVFGEIRYFKEGCACKGPSYICVELQSRHACQKKRCGYHDLVSRLVELASISSLKICKSLCMICHLKVNRMISEISC